VTNTSQLLTTAQVAEIIGRSPRHVSRLVQRGELTPAAEAPGGARGRAYAYLFDARDVEVYKLRQQQREAS
jgi:hypothetical protein